MAEPLVTFEQAQAVTEFAQALYAYDQFGFWSPMLSNQLLQSLNNNPETPSSDKIRKALAEYKENSDQIQGYMEYMKFWDMIFARTLQAYCNALSLTYSLFVSMLLLRVIMNQAHTKRISGAYMIF